MPLAARGPSAPGAAEAAPGEPSARSGPLARGTQRLSALLPASGRAGRVVAAMRDTGRRNIYFSLAAIPSHLLMAAWKGALTIASPSLFMFANVLFTLGLAAVKLLVVLADRQSRRRGDGAVLARAYRWSGLVLVVCSLGYAALCLPLVFGEGSTERYSYEVAIAIATVTFVELGFSIHGFMSSRRRHDLLMEAVKLSNVAASLILLVLTQTALLSMTSETDHSRYNGVCGIVMAAIALLIGLRMCLRRLPSRTDAPS
ncbi:hypothetical protein K5S26_15490 [Microbacterium marinilacus]|nr:hypothetical protein [Microbacterium marinilacus]